MFKKWLDYYQSWWNSQTKTQHWQWLGVGMATLFGAAYRLYNLQETLQFQADQGRDAIIAFGILQGDLTLVGPSTSVGDMFLGPLYYYFMAPWLWIFGLNPIGPAVGVALIGIITVPILYLVGKRLVGNTPAFLATLLFSFGPLVAEYTRFSWNPNPMPMVTLIILYAIWRAWKGSAWWWVVAATAWTVIIQLHYVALLTAVPLGIFWLADLWRTMSGQVGSKSWRDQIKAIFFSVAIFFISIVPLLLFNWRFNNIIWHGFADFFQGSGNEVTIPLSTKLWSVFKEQEGRSMQLLFELWGGKDWTVSYRSINTWLLRGYIVLLAVGAWCWRKSRYQLGYNLLLVTALTSVLGLAFYKGTVHHHYITYFYPVSYLLTGLVMVQLVRLLKQMGLVLAVLLFIYISWLQTTPDSLDYLRPASWQVTDMEAVSKKILSVLPAEKTYLFAALTEVRDYRGLNYRYFLVTSDNPPVALEKFGDADLLTIVAENPTEPELVLNSPVHEVQTFPVGEYSRYQQVAGGPDVYVVERAKE